MKPKKRSFLFHSAVYWIGKILGRSISIVLLPIYTAYIVPSEYGVLSILGIIINIFTLVLSIQLPTAIFRFWAKADTEHEKETIISSSLIVTVLLPAVFLLPLYIWAKHFAQLLDVATHVDLLRLILFEVQLALIIAIFYADMRIKDESRMYSFIEIFQNFSIGALSVFFVVYLGFGIKGMILSQVIIFILIIAFCAIRFLKRTTIRFDSVLIKKMIWFSLPLIPAAVAMAAVHTSDRIFIQKMLGAADTGIYTIGYKFGMLVSILVVGPFLLIWEPKSFEIAREENSAEKFGEIFSYLIVVVSFVAVALTGLSREIVMVLTDEKYWTAWSVIPWVAWSYVFFAMSMVVRVGLLVEKKTVLSAWVVFLVFSVNIAGNFLLIPKLGMLGAAVSTLISFVIYFSVNLLCSYQYIPIKFEWKKILYLFVLIIFVTIAMNLVQVNNVLLSVVVKLLVLSVMFVLLFRLGFFTKLELMQRIRPYLPGMKNR